MEQRSIYIYIYAVEVYIAILMFTYRKFSMQTDSSPSKIEQRNFQTHFSSESIHVLVKSIIYIYIYISLSPILSLLLSLSLSLSLSLYFSIYIPKIYIYIYNSWKIDCNPGFHGVFCKTTIIINCLMIVVLQKTPWNPGSQSIFNELDIYIYIYI